MKDNPNIDRLFQESFKDFEVQAPQNAWQNIEKQLKANKKPIVPLWKKISAAAAIIAVLIIAGSQWLIGSQFTDTNNSIVESPEENFSTPKNSDNTSEQLFVTPSDGSKDKASSETTIASAVNEDNEENSMITKDKLVSSNKTSITSNNTQIINQYQRPQDKNTSAITSNYKGSTITDNYSEQIALNSKPIKESYSPLFASKINDAESGLNTNVQELQSLVEVAQQIYEDKTFEEPSAEKRSWFVKPQISPTFYGNMGSGSAIDENLAQNSGSGNVDMSYGVNVAYQINDRIKIRSGVNRVNLNYSTNEVYVIPGSGYSSFANANITGNFQSSIVTEQQFIDLNAENLLGRFPSESSELQQQLGYIEIPMELEYRLLDKGINVNIIGGASTLLLNNNNLDIKTGNSTTSIGEANNLNDVSFSTNFALGFDYDISDRLMLNLEPTFKYQFNTFQSGTTNFQPYFFGIYSGVVFKF
jgi:hypothetical protein